MKEKEFVDVLNEKIKYIEGIPYYNDKVKLKKILDGLLYITLITSTIYLEYIS